MKIAVFFHDCEISSGATASMYTLVESWYNMGVEIVAYASYEGTLFQTLREMGIKCKIVRSINSRYNKGRNILRQLIVRIYSLSKIPKYKRYIKKTLVEELKNEGVNIIYANTSACVTGYYARKYTDIPLVWHVREFGELDQNVSYVGGKEKLYTMLGKADLLIFISKAIANYYQEASKQTKSIVVYDDLSCSYNLFKEKDFTQRPLRILTCGALNPGKGHMDVIKAIGILRDKGYDVELNIAGGGEMYRSLHTSLIKRMGLEDSVHLLGHVKNVDSIRKESEIGIVASRMEAFGRVTIEGMLSGLAMIGANSGGTAELIDDEKTGILYEAGNVEKLADSIEKLINDPKQAKKIAYNGYLFSKRFIEGNCANTIYNELKKIVNE